MHEPTTDRRRSGRRRPKSTTEITCRPDTLVVGPNLARTVLDISADGIRLIVTEPLAVGQKIEVDLEGIGYCRPLKLSAEVVWSLAAADGTWCVGARF